VLAFAFVLWFVWSFLNDSQGRLYGWTDGKYGTPPLSVREQIAKDTQDKLDKAKAAKAAASAAATPVPASVATVTNAVPTK